MYAFHPMLVHLPIGAFLASTIFLVLAQRRGHAGLAYASLASLSLGLIAAVPAIVSGLFDAWRQLSGPETARTDPRILMSNLHALATLVAVGWYFAAWQQQRRGPGGERRVLVRHIAGAIALIVGGWLGGYLVYRLGLGQLS